MQAQNRDNQLSAFVQSILTAGHLIKKALRHRGYLGALSSGYLLMLASILIQISLVPLYLEKFGKYQFGVLMVILSLVNFAVIGIVWMSGGALRLLGEYAGKGNKDEFYHSYLLIKTIYVGYGLILALIIGFVASTMDRVLFSGGSMKDISAGRTTLLLTGVYLVLFFGAAIDRIALTASKRQGAANMAQLAGIIAFAASVTPWLLSNGSMPGVMLFQSIGALVSLLITRRMLNFELNDLRTSFSLLPILDLVKRLGGKTGAGFFLHGVIVLALMADTALVGWLGGANAAAEFYLVWKIAEVIVQLIWKLSEPMAPYFVQMDVRGEHSTLAQIARYGFSLVAGVALLAGVFYGVFGPYLVALWIGDRSVPDSPFGYALAGGAIFWLGISRLSVVFAGARVALRDLNWVGGLELFGKLLFTLLLFPRIGFNAVLLAINLVHALGISVLYFRLLQVKNTTA